MELDPSVELAELGKFDTTEFDTWFESGRIYLLINPSGTRPMSFGPDDRCIVIGLDSDGEIDALALQLKPATYVQELEQSPPWVSFKKIDHRIMITISSSGPGLSQIQEKRQYGFNIMITGQTGALNSWAPLTTAFPWDAPSIWGLINLEK
jgi:hypothetical protein